MSAARRPAPRAHPAAPRLSAERPWLAALGVFLFGVLVYANTLGHGFVWDDTIWLEQKIRFYRGPLDAFFEPTFMPMRQVYRPLSQLTYWLDQELWWRNAFGFHLTSVLLHAANGVLVLTLARAIGLTLRPAVAAALLFLAHPIQPQSVAWLTNRVDVLATLFVLVAILAALRPTSPATLAVVALASFGAAASKETGCVVPALVLATALLDVPARGRRPLIAAAVSALGVVPYFFLRPSEAGSGIPLDSVGSAAVGRLVGSLGYQVERLLLPVGFWPYLGQVPMDAITIALAVLGALAAGTGLALPDRAGGRRRFTIVWIVVAAALPVIVVLADFSSLPVAEHRLYLATVGIALLAATAWQTWSRHARAEAIAVGVTLLVITAVTIDRNRFWRDELTLWTAVTERDATQPLPFLNLGLALADAGRPAEAETAYRRTLALRPNAVTRQRVSINLGLILVEQGQLDEAETLFTTANGIGGHAIAYRGLALVARKRGQAALRAGDTTTANTELTRGMTAITQALAINPRYHQGHSTRAGILYDAGRYSDAVASYREAAALAGDTPGGRQAAASADELSAWLAAHPEAR